MKIMPNYSKFKIITVRNLFLMIFVNLILMVIIFIYCNNFLEPKVYDFLIKLTLNKKASSDIVNVTIDDPSLTRVGKWPWNRSTYADIIEYLQKYEKAKIVILDSIIVSDNPSEDSNFLKKIEKNKNFIIGLFFSKEKDFFDKEKNSALNKILKEKFSIKVEDSRSNPLIKQAEYNSSSYSINGLLTKVNGAGSVLTNPDRDGIIRRFEPIVFFNGSYYPSLALSVYSKDFKSNNYKLTKNYLTDIKGLKIPIHKTTSGIYQYIKWYRPVSSQEASSHKSYSAWKLLKSLDNVKNGKLPLLPKETFKDKIVVIGATATAIKDLRATPLLADYPGVDIQATCIDNLIHNDVLRRPPLIVEILLYVSLISVLLLVILYLTPLYLTITALFIMLLYFHLCLFSFSKNYIIDVITPEVLLVYFTAIGYAYNFFVESLKKNSITSLLAKYVSQEVLDDILKDDNVVKLGGKRAEISVLFADIRDFTSLSETLEPEELSSILNTYFREIVPIIFKNKGMINKFMGDAILAVFGAPVDCEDHAGQAVNCAVEMLDKVSDLKSYWEKEGKPNIQIGISVNTGIAFVGNIGSEDRLEYTVIGDTVNTAYRLEELNKIFHTKLLIGATTYECVQEMVEAIKLDAVPIKGKADPIDIYIVQKINN